MSQGLLGSELLPLILLKLVRDLPLIISLSIILSLIFSLSKFCQTSELIIISNSGIGDYQLLKILQPLLISFVLIVASFSIIIVPDVNLKIELFKANAKSRPDYIFFKGGVFQEFQQGNIVFYSPDVKYSGEEDNQTIDNVFLYHRDIDRLILAKKAFKEIDLSTGDILLNMHNGTIYNNINTQSKREISISDFDKFNIKIFENLNSKSKIQLNSPELRNISALILSMDNESMSELFYRFSIPIMLLLMLIISVLISKKNPRDKRNFSIGYGLFFFLTYYNLILIFKEFETTNLYQVFMYFLAPHLIFIFVIFFILFLINNPLNFSQKYAHKTIQKA